jgi:hypothetical protein
MNADHIQNMQRTALESTHLEWLALGILCEIALQLQRHNDIQEQSLASLKKVTGENPK